MAHNLVMESHAYTVLDKILLFNPEGSSDWARNIFSVCKPVQIESKQKCQLEMSHDTTTILGQNNCATGNEKK